MKIATLGGTILIGQIGGDRPAIVTKVFSNTAVEAHGFMPAPEVLKLVTLHECRIKAVEASEHDGQWHGYHQGKAD